MHESCSPHIPSFTLDENKSTGECPAFRQKNLPAGHADVPAPKVKEKKIKQRKLRTPDNPI